MQLTTAHDVLEQILGDVSDEQVHHVPDGTALPVSAFVVGHANNLMGEIAAVKGFQGLKGYPF